MPRIAAAPAFALTLAVVLTPAAAALEVPSLSGRVVDRGDLLSAAAEQRITAQLTAFEGRTGTQMAVLTLASLEGEPLEDYSLRVAERWRLGRADADDGVLLLISRDDRKMRLEVGYGLEARLTDLASRRILDEVVRPRFRAGDYDGGVEAGVAAVLAVVEEGQSALPPPAAGPDAEDGGGFDWSIGPVILLVFVLVLADFLARALWMEGMAGWLLYALIAVPAFTVPATMVGRWFGLASGLAWLLGVAAVRLWVRRRGEPAWLAWMRRKSQEPRSGGSRWSIGSGGSSGGGFSGGGFSGGGGSFGGGGASSGW